MALSKHSVCVSQALFHLKLDSKSAPSNKKRNYWICRFVCITLGPYDRGNCSPVAYHLSFLPRFASQPEKRPLKANDQELFHAGTNPPLPWASGIREPQTHMNGDSKTHSSKTRKYKIVKMLHIPDFRSAKGFSFSSYSLCFNY
eukprot:4661077-Amphidinium_carterae.1